MGVQGITPFLQKTCPAVLKRLKSRLQSLQGKQLIIDATLITQRLHYSQSSNPSPHILGWYRIVKELNASGVSAVCVFDGKSRHIAKTHEVERRREVRRLANARYSIEKDRSQRLYKFKDALQFYKGFDAKKKRELSTLLADSTFSPQPDLAVLLEDHSSIGTLPQDDASAKSATAPLSTDSAALPPTVQQTAHLLKSLHLSYQANLAKLVSLSVETQEGHTKTIPAKYEDSTEKVMTKVQHELTLAEGKIWKALGDSLGSLVTHPELLAHSLKAEKDLFSLLERNHYITASYEKRVKIPTRSTYKESKRILRALGVPCIETTEAIEAEALASSMVLSGLGDYVVSEDTDVLLYEVPMIKNLTDKHNPLVVVSGSEVRKALELTRESFIDFALLLGTDFSRRIKSVGPARALQFMKEYGSIERMLESEPKYSLKVPLDAYLAQIKIARLVFSTRPENPTIPKVKRDEDEVSRIMSEHDLSRILVEEEFCDSWNPELALAGNLFNDNPTAEGPPL